MARKRTKDTYAVRAQLARMARQVYGDKLWNSRRSGGYTREQYTGKSDAQYKSESDARHAMPADWKTPPRSRFAKKATMVSASANAVG